MSDLKKPSNELTGKDYGRILIPGILFALTVFMVAVAWAALTGSSPAWLNILFFTGLTGSIYGLFAGLIFYHGSEVMTPHRSDWFHVVVIGISLGLAASISPVELIFIAYIFFILNVISASLVFSRIKTYSLVVIAFLVHFGIALLWKNMSSFLDILFLLSFPILAVSVSETILRFENTVGNSLAQVSTLNAISRKLSSSLDEDEVHTWVKEAIQDVLNADSYYLALVNGDSLDLGLFYDDGEYFHAVQVPLAGTLGGWVIRHNQTLFLKDLRVEPELEGVKTRLIGQEKTSLSWVGVPIKTEYVTGMIGIASYTPLAFSQDDVDLLENLTQQAALALNNARQHKLVTLQARTDSLTKIYNHGYFLEELNQNLMVAAETNSPLCLIMLDVDYFKNYNDTYGHLVGDEVLILLVKTIRRFIKTNDFFGRWGGEEFAIALPNATLVEARQVALRIQETVQKMQISVLDQHDIPVPTVSQGIAEFPTEATEVFKLVDLADQRLYIAKERGRNQIEPDLTE